MRAEKGAQPGFAKRLAMAGTNLLIPLHTGLLVAYFILRELGGRDLWFIEACGFVLFWLFLPLVGLLPAALLRRSRVLLALVAIPIAFFLLTYGELYLPRGPVRATGPEVSVMAYNVWNNNPDADQVAAVIEKGAPDIIGLHELTGPMAQALGQELGEQYPYRQVDPWVGLFSRYPILECEAFRPDQGRGLWAQQCLVDIDGNQVNVLNVHPRSPPLKAIRPFGLSLGVPVGFANQGRDADVRDLLVRLEKTDGPLLVIGDFNLTDQQSIYKELTQDLSDAHRESGWGQGLTFLYYRSLGISMWRIDYLFYSQDFVALSARTGEYGGSDHRPVIARLAFRAPEERLDAAGVQAPEPSGIIVQYQAGRRDLSGSDLWYAYLYRADLRGASLAGANLGWADLSGANLDQASLHGVRLDGATQIDAKGRLVWEIVNEGRANGDLVGADLTWANLHGASLSGADLRGADLGNATLYRADLGGADLSEAILSGANLSQADLSGADLSGADLSGADLSKANLHGVNLRGARLDGATVALEQLEQAASLEGVIMPDGLEISFE